MNVYERILNILLEARVDIFIQDRLDESRVDELNKATMKRALAKGKDRVEAAHRASDTGGDSRMGSKSGPTTSSQAAKRPQRMMAKIKGRLSGDKTQQAADRARAQHTATSTDQAGRDARIKQRGMERRATEKISKRSDESKNSLKTREFMKSWEGQAAKTASSGSDAAIKDKKLDRAGKMRRAGNVSGARAEIAKSQKLDKPQIP